MNEPTINNMVERLDRLERENRRWRRIGSLVLVVIAAVVLKESKEPNRKIQWAAITALLWAAFPKWFDRDGNPIVNPIRSVKYAFKSPLNKEAHLWWSLVVRGKPAKADTYASIVFPEED